LHDTGYSNRPAQHHKGSRDLIVASDIEGFSRRELAVIACVARYHRKALPAKSHSVYADLDAADQALVRKLAAILRIADGLDRSHCASVESISVTQERGVVRIGVKQRAPHPVDIETAVRKGDLFEQTFGVKLEVCAEVESRKEMP
jgi:exopolyphosphatase/guanosine-5'-triphosphate,3'-diphosphate pyrophosphatase